MVDSSCEAPNYDLRAIISAAINVQNVDYRPASGDFIQSACRALVSVGPVAGRAAGAVHAAAQRELSYGSIL
jgi:hypothetical protein